MPYQNKTRTKNHAATVNQTAIVWSTGSNRKAYQAVPHDSQPAKLLAQIDAERSPGQCIKFDLRGTLKGSTFTGMQYASGFFCDPPVKEVRLVCHRFPWEIFIKKKTHLTYGDVWGAVWSKLQSDLEQPLWTVADNSRQSKILRAVQRREKQLGKRDLQALRIDWLGEATLFAGLQKPELIAPRMPGVSKDIATWSIRLEKPTA
ncbi:hypothetical protein NM688_g1639 [Phlebia brevispora]|uniref:Uncharacterized protein n=1 Tax=Phlebia brevispora TaxID=194682 RepID=A0ACC1TAJ3_9APHY|nr:hypothetical protein NM688_g1639 [Phlebia brevispora]